jgi:hypothetical protein
MEISMEVPKKIKLKRKLPHDPAIHFWVYSLKNQSQLITDIIYVPILITALFTIVKLWNQPWYPSTDEWI